MKTKPKMYIDCLKRMTHLLQVRELGKHDVIYI